MSNGTSFACYGCVDFVNNERTAAYWQWACSQGMIPPKCQPNIFTLCKCEADSPETPYTNPIDDEVCWYDSATPESAEFLGVIILNRVVKDSTITREVSDGFKEGSILNRAMLKGRSFTFDVLLLAASCEGMAYGKEWLRSVLEDAPCQGGPISQCSSCFGRELTLRVFCPDEESTDDGLHEWMSVGIVDGLQEVEDGSGRGACCCVLQHYTFTMQSESPYSFSTEPVNICSSDADPEGFVRCYDWSSDCIECDCGEIQCDRCRFDPLCDDTDTFTFDPELPADDCDDCAPLATVVQSCCSDDLPAIYDTTFRIQIYSGVNPDDAGLLRRGMRNFRLRIYQNPKDLDCITDEESYALWCNEKPCIEIKTRYIPYDSTLTIDGRTEKVTLSCNNVCRPFDHVVTAVDGSLFPLLSRCTPLMVVADFDYYTSQLEPTPVGEDEELDLSIRPSHISVDSYLRFRQ